MSDDSSSGAIVGGSPGDCNSHAGKYGESTPLRQRGGSGYGLSLTLSDEKDRA